MFIYIYIYTYLILHHMVFNMYSICNYLYICMLIVCSRQIPKSKSESKSLSALPEKKHHECCWASSVRGGYIRDRQRYMHTIPIDYHWKIQYTSLQVPLGWFEVQVWRKIGISTSICIILITPHHARTTSALG